MSSQGLAHRMQTLDEVTISQGLEYMCPQAGHNPHACHYIRRVSELHSNAGERGAQGTHAERKHIHGAALHASWESLVHSSLELIWGHPVAQLPTGPTSQERHCVPLRRSYNHRLAFYPCHILGVCAGQPAVLILGELPDKTLLFQQGQRGSVLSLSPITNMDACWLAQMGTALHKVSNPSRQLAQISTEHAQGLDATAW